MGGCIIQNPSTCKRKKRGDDLHRKGLSHKSILKKQIINARSSTISELVGVHKASPQVLWTKEFLKNQVFKLKKETLYHDNMIAMLLDKNGSA